MGLSLLSHDVWVLADYDFHPDEPTVRVFRTPSTGVLRLDDDVAVTEAIWDGVVLRHYAFADRWFKVNITTDLDGDLVETGDADNRFAVNCDIATPMEREDEMTFAVDLFIDVLIRADRVAYVVGDEDEFEEMFATQMFSPREARCARGGLVDLLELVERGRLVPWLNELVPFGPTEAPEALPMRRAPIPRRLQPVVRRTWSQAPTEP